MFITKRYKTFLLDVKLLNSFHERVLTKRSKKEKQNRKRKKKQSTKKNEKRLIQERSTEETKPLSTSDGCHDLRKLICPREGTKGLYRFYRYLMSFIKRVSKPF